MIVLSVIILRKEKRTCLSHSRYDLLIICLYVFCVISGVIYEKI